MAGALCERDTFQGERCLYNALTERIRTLLLSYDYSKSSDPLQPLAAHITSLLIRDHPQTSDIVVASANKSFSLHKFVLSARSPYFQKKLSSAPETTSYKLTAKIPPQAFETAIKYLYLGEIPNDVGGGPGTGFTEEEIVDAIEKLSKQLEIRSLWEGILKGEDRRLARQHRTDEVEKGRNQLEAWFRNNVLKHEVIIHTAKASDVKWDRDNSIFADVLLQADEPSDYVEADDLLDDATAPTSDNADTIGIPIGPTALRSESHTDQHRTSTLFPVHRAMLVRSDYFQTMFSSAFVEAQQTPHLNIINLNCSPEVLEVILTYLYTEKSDIPLKHAIEVLDMADLLLIEKLKVKATLVISTLGNGSINHSSSSSDPTTNDTTPQQDQDPLNIYEVIRAAWDHRVPRLEVFAARYLANRLEAYIDQPEFADLIRESAARIEKRQETDSIELLDDIRYYLSERFRLRFEDTGIEEMIDEIENENENEHEHEGTATNGTSDHANFSNGAAIDHTNTPEITDPHLLPVGAVRTLDGEIAGDEFASDAVNYQLLLGKIDALLESLRLDA